MDAEGFYLQLRHLTYLLAIRSLSGVDWPSEHLATPDLDEAEVEPEDRKAALLLLNLEPTRPDELGRIHQALLSFQPQLDDADGLRLIGGRGRWAKGAYYTPDALIECLLDHALEPAIQQSIASAPTAAEASVAILRIRVLDPAVGSGRFLVAAARRLAQAASVALSDVVEHCLYGVDLDPAAVELARATLWLASEKDPDVIAPLCSHLRMGNSLVGATEGLVAQGIPSRAYDKQEGDDLTVCRELRRLNRNRLPAPNVLGHLAFDGWCAAHTMPKQRGAPQPPTNADWPKLLGDEARYLEVRNGTSLDLDNQDDRWLSAIVEEASTHAFFHFPLEFPGVEFDVVIGNPPFVNAIEKATATRAAGIVAMRTPDVAGAADLSFRFLAAAVDWIKPAGRIGFVMPRAALNARSLDAFRASPPRGLAPRMIAALDRADYFSEASVFVSMLVLGPPGPCLVPDPEGRLSTEWVELLAVGSNWYLAARGLVDSEAVAESETIRIGDLFEVAASMTAGDAYTIASLLIDDAKGKGLRLVTTGLIEPEECLWGERSCRYLGRDLRHPRITLSGEMPASLGRRLASARRPKVLVAGLSNRVEAFLDDRGHCQGAVSTFTILHPADDVSELRRVCGFLNLPSISERLRRELGANALGGGSITLRKEWIKQLPLGQSLEG